MNPFLLIALIAPPLLVFSAKPSTQKLLRTARLIIAILLFYGVVPFAMDWHYEALRETEDTSRSGGNYTFFLLLGWLWATTYTGWWEIFWRRKHKHDMISLWRGVGDDLLSNIIVRISVYCAILFAVVFAIVLGEAVYHLLFL